VSASRLVNRNIVAGGGRTSMRLEPELWDAVLEICRREGWSLGDLVQGAEQTRLGVSGRTSAVRVYTLNYFRMAATEAGHLAAGHRGLTADSHAAAPDQPYAVP
jgi:predicted DNA-binding ribbon-helix-helix protein